MWLLPAHRCLHPPCVDVLLMVLFSPAPSTEDEWVPLELCFGMPLFSSELNRRVCQKIASHKLCSKDRYKWACMHARTHMHAHANMHVHTHRTLSYREGSFEIEVTHNGTYAQQHNNNGNNSWNFKMQTVRGMEIADNRNVQCVQYPSKIIDFSQLSEFNDSYLNTQQYFSVFFLQSPTAASREPEALAGGAEFRPVIPGEVLHVLSPTSTTTPEPSHGRADHACNTKTNSTKNFLQNT